MTVGSVAWGAHMRPIIDRLGEWAVHEHPGRTARRVRVIFRREYAEALLGEVPIGGSGPAALAMSEDLVELAAGDTLELETSGARWTIRSPRQDHVRGTTLMRLELPDA